MQFHPATYEELAKLVKDERIYLGDIDTSRVENMRWLFCDSKRKDFSGIEKWHIDEKCRVSRCAFRNTPLKDNPPKWFVDKIKAQDSR